MGSVVASGASSSTCASTAFFIVVVVFFFFFFFFFSSTCFAMVVVDSALVFDLYLLFLAFFDLGVRPSMLPSDSRAFLPAFSHASSPLMQRIAPRHNPVPAKANTAWALDGLFSFIGRLDMSLQPACGESWTSWAA